MKKSGKHLYQILWHIVPVSVVFLILAGAQLFILGLLATILILISGGEGDIVGPNAVRELAGVLLIILLNSLLPCIVLLPLALMLDKLTRNRAIWLNLMLPLLFILMSAILALPPVIYFFTDTPETGYSYWLSFVNGLAVLLVGLAVTLALFVPYWYSLQIERLLVWLARNTQS